VRIPPAAGPEDEAVRTPPATFACAIALLALGGTRALAADPERGAELYANHCTGCHTSQAHIREHHKVDGPQALRAWVDRWQRNQTLRWSAADIEDVAAYLDSAFYKFTPVVKQ
jgi:mono/diheme cytochrome c family protein